MFGEEEPKVQTAFLIVFIYMAAINAIAFAAMGIDKRRARASGKRRRIPEQRLFLISAIGGAAGTLLGMKVWRHKTKHRSFTVGVPFLLSLNLLLLLFVVWLIASGTAQ